MDRTCRNCAHFIEGQEINCLEGGPTEIADPDKIMTMEDCNAWSSVEEEMYELTAEILVMGYNPEDALCRVKKQTFVNDVIEEAKIVDWSHLDEPSKFSSRTPEQQKEHKEYFIKELTRRVRHKEARA
ncbi:MAG: hypothetical protein NWE89_08725 [Candidatus Bathyarchaeota archaeon]|nr:hypothetical protein [Candidatus Bathyarchaeota archaeon]